MSIPGVRFLRSLSLLSGTPQFKELLLFHFLRPWAALLPEVCPGQGLFVKQTRSPVHFPRSGEHQLLAIPELGGGGSDVSESAGERLRRLPLRRGGLKIAQQVRDVLTLRVGRGAGQQHNFQSQPPLDQAHAGEEARRSLPGEGLSLSL